MFSRKILQRVTCLDCARLGGCAEAYRLSTKDGPRTLLDHICERRWKPCSPAATVARWDTLESLGLLALRGMIKSQTNTEDEVTRAAREQELQALNRMDMRKVAMQTGFPHKESLKAKSTVMIQFVLDKEFPEDDKPAEKEATTKPKGGSKKATTTTKPKGAGKKATTPAAPAGDEAIAALGGVLDSHGEALDAIITKLDAILDNQLKTATLLQNLGYGIMEPEDWDALVGDAFPELADAGEAE